MRVTSFAPSAPLRPHVRVIEIVETEHGMASELLPEVGLIVGFRYRGAASQVIDGVERPIEDAVLTGLRRTLRRVRTSPSGGIVLVKFRETGAARFFEPPLHELFGRSLGLAELMPRAQIEPVEEALSRATTDAERVGAVERFLQQRFRVRGTDALVNAALASIREARGAVRIGALARSLGSSQDFLEKRFRRVVGASPKQLASLVRLRGVIDAFRPGCNLAAVARGAGYYDQSHFIRDFRSFAGEAPERFLRAGVGW